MRELKTLEVDKWVPTEKKGIVRHAGMIGAQEAFAALKAHLEKEGLMPDEYFSPNSWSWGGMKTLPEYSRANCTVDWGGSEGIYLDIQLQYIDEENRLQMFSFATGKTLDSSGDAFLRMSRIAAECSMMLNGRGEIVRFYEDERGFIRPQEQEPAKAALDDNIRVAELEAQLEKANRELAAAVACIDTVEEQFAHGACHDDYAESAIAAWNNRQKEEPVFELE